MTESCCPPQPNARLASIDCREELALENYDYQLPPSSIAQTPLAERDQARLLVASDAAGASGTSDSPQHLQVCDLPQLLNSGDVLALNDARVQKARLQLRKPTGGAVEVLALEPASEHAAATASDTWLALVRPSRRVPAGTTLLSAQGDPVVVVGEDLGEGQRLVWPADPGKLALPELLAQHGSVPLPPYITTELADDNRYQTVYADQPTAVAAPTAGLHMTPGLLEQLQSQGVAVHRLSLSVGLGTFRPITTASITDHDIHAESYRIPASTWQACQAAQAGGQRVVAVGTTVVRALESAARSQNSHLQGRTDLYITPGFKFQMVDALLTNFHLPRSTLLVLLAAFMGPRWRELYETALQEGYRFLSFGDAMFCVRERPHSPAAP